VTDRDALYRGFVERFHAGKRARPAAEAKVDAAEAALGVLWPESYRRFVLRFGSPWVPAILDLVCDRRADFSDVQQFLTPREAVVETRRSGLAPDGAWTVLATDCSGNLFAFRDLPAAPPRPDDAPVWRFDHEEGETKLEAPSFDAWLARFLSL